MDATSAQRAHLEKTIAWAKQIRAVLQPLLEAHGDRVHFRPSSSGVSMVGLLPDRPQRGKSGIRNLQSIAKNFESTFAEHCNPDHHGKPTGEKASRARSFARPTRTTEGSRR